MSVEIYASGATLADGTEQYLSSPSVAGEFAVEIDRTNMAAGDILYVRVYRTVVSGGSPVLAAFDILTGAVATNQTAVWSWEGANGLIEANALRVSIQQTTGTYRNFPWAVTRVTEQADVTKWNGTAVATPATAGVPSVEATAIASTVRSGLIDEIWDEPLAGHSVDGTAGDELKDTGANVVDLTAGVTVVSNLDKSNYALSSASRAAVADSVWDEPLSGHAAAGSTGEALTSASGASGITVEEIVAGLSASTITIVNPFDSNTAEIAIGYGEDYTSGSINGLLTITTTESIDLQALGGTIYFAVRPRNAPASSTPSFTLTGTATAATTFTVSLSNTYTRQLLPATYNYSAWHVTAGGVRTTLAHGDYVVSDLVQPTVS